MLFQCNQYLCYNLHLFRMWTCLPWSYFFLWMAFATSGNTVFVCISECFKWVKHFQKSAEFLKMDVSWLVCDLTCFNNNMSRIRHFEWLEGRPLRLFQLVSYSVIFEYFNCQRRPSIWVCQFVNHSTSIDLHQLSLIWLNPLNRFQMLFAH